MNDRPALRSPVTGPSAWIGADLRQRPADWTYTLSAAEVAEVEAAVASVRARGLDIADLTRGHFPLPRFGAKLDALRNEVLNGRGFILMRGWPALDKPIEDNATAYCGIGTYFGAMRTQNAAGHLLGHVRDVGAPPAAIVPTVRAYQTAERQLFHTDGADIVALLCLRTAKSGGLSSLVSSMSIYNRMATEHPGLLARLMAPIPFDRRGEVPEGSLGWYTVPVILDYAGQMTIHYSRRNIDSSQRHPDAPRLTGEDTAALDLFDTLANDADLRLDMELAPGDMQFLHNHTILHDRTAFQDWPEAHRKRHLLRLWLSPPDARPLDPRMAERFGSVTVGDRGGIVVPGARPNVPLAVV
jgi:hypothetical protein